MRGFATRPETPLRRVFQRARWVNYVVGFAERQRRFGQGDQLAFRQFTGDQPPLAEQHPRPCTAASIANEVGL